MHGSVGNLFKEITDCIVLQSQAAVRARPKVSARFETKPSIREAIRGADRLRRADNRDVVDLTHASS